MGKQMFHLVRRTFTGLLLVSAILLSAGICAAFYDSSGNYYPGDSAASQSADIGIQKALGGATYNAMMNGIRQNTGYVPSSTANPVNNWMVSNSGGNYVSGPYDWKRPYLGDATVNYLNAHQNDATPIWANVDTSKMSPIGANIYNKAKADAEYWHNKRFENLGRY